MTLDVYAHVFDEFDLSERVFKGIAAALGVSMGELGKLADRLEC